MKPFRILTARPGFSCLVIAALALGIGGNAALFTVLDGVLFRPLPYERAGELYEISHERRESPLEALRQSASFSSVTAFIPAGLAVFDGTATLRRYGMRVEPNLFETLGARAMIGRTSAAEPFVVLAHEYWRTQYGSADVIGRQFVIDERPYTVIGVMPPEFILWFRDVTMYVAGKPGGGRVIGRMKAGVSAAQAASEVSGILAGLPAERGRRPDARVIPMNEAFRPNDFTTLLLLQGAVALVLLITCANVGNLMLVRAAAKRREFAIRTAMGATPWRLAREALAEGAVLAGLGGALGLAATAASLGMIARQLPASISRGLRGPEALTFDYRVALFTAVAAMAALFLCCAAPVIGSLRFDIVSQLKDSARGLTGRQRLGRVLAAAEIGLAVMLLIGAGLTVKSILHLRGRNLGFSAEGVLRAAVELPEARFREAIERLEALPGVEAVGVLAPQLFPFGGPRVRGAVFEIQGEAHGEPRAEVYTANGAYFRAVRLPLLAGRLFQGNESEPVALISDAVARRHFGGAGPVGRMVRLEPAGPWITVIGVIGDVRNPVGMDVQPTLYLPWHQNPQRGATLMIRSQGDPMALAPAVRREVKALVPDAPEARTASLQRGVADYLSPQRFVTSTLGAFAGVGMLLAAVGVYGVMRYWVHARIPEMGVRMALGARRSDVVSLVLGRAAVTALAGGAMGVAGALALQKVIASQLHGVSATDPTVYAAVPAAMAGVALLAAWLPARFAARVDPLVALREQ